MRQNRYRFQEARKKLRLIKPTFLIVNGGVETEYNYFVAFSKELHPHADVHVLKAGRDVVSLVKKAMAKVEQRKKEDVTPYTRAWCVVDVEVAESVRKDIQNAQALIRKQRADMELCLSNPCFEVWFLAHYVRSDRAFHNCNAVIDDLKRYMTDYEKSLEGIYAHLAPKLPDAIKNARACLSPSLSALDKNSSTEIYRMMEALLPSTKEN